MVTKGRVLVVDDVPGARNLACRMLVSLGYSVTMAQNAAEAIAAVDSGQGYDVLFTDVILPDMNGVELARIVARRVAGIKILFTSGLPNLTSEQLLELKATYVSKPYRKAEIAGLLLRITGD